jgi:hypothetical protein
MAGLVVSGVSRVEFTECRFGAEPETRSTPAFAGVAVVGSTTPNTRTRVQIGHCYFGPRRGAGFDLVGDVSAEAVESAFAPHAAVFAVRNQGDSPVNINLRHCTFLMDGGSVVEADETGRAEISAGYCVFATPPAPNGEAATPPAPGDRPARPTVVLHETGTSHGDARFTGDGPNAYFRVAPYALGKESYTFSKAVANWVEPPATDEQAVD